MGVVCKCPPAGLGAQKAHHRAVERRPFGLRAKLLQHSCNDASSRCRSQANRFFVAEKETIGRGVGAPTDSYFNLNLCPPSWFTVIRLSLNMVIMWRAG